MHILTPNTFTLGLLATVLPFTFAKGPPDDGPPGHGVPGSPPWNGNNMGKLRTVVTTDMEQDDLASLIRYLLYTNDLETQGLIYSAGRYHWAGNGSELFMPDREYKTPQLSWRWTGTRYIQDIVIPAYAQVYSNLLVHDSSYPSPSQLQSIVKVGNIVFEGDMSFDTEGSDLIKSLLLDHDPRTLYLQAWGGTNTIGRALMSIELQYSGSRQWPSMKAAISRKAVIMASGFQDNTYIDYISIAWPAVRIENMMAGYGTWAYNCNAGQGNVHGDSVGAGLYFTGDWIHANIETGPYGKLYRSWLDGQSMPGDQLDGFGNLTLAGIVDSWCPAQTEPYAFLSEGDNVAFNPLIPTGIQDPSNPLLGGWGGRATQNSTSPDLWVQVAEELNQQTGVETATYTTDRWMAPIQLDFAARMQWTLTSNYGAGNHAPSVRIIGKGNRGRYGGVTARAGSTVTLGAVTEDPDHDTVATSWFQYREEGTYPGTVTVTATNNNEANIQIPADAKAGQTISIILQGTDGGEFPLTRYDRAIITVQ